MRMCVAWVLVALVRMQAVAIAYLAGWARCTAATGVLAAVHLQLTRSIECLVEDMASTQTRVFPQCFHSVSKPPGADQQRIAGCRQTGRNAEPMELDTNPEP